MVSIEEIKKRIANVIQREIDITEKEKEEFEEKIRENSYQFGGGGWFTQFNKALERREEHLEDLKAIQKGMGKAVKTKKVRMHPYYCPNCQAKIYLPYQPNKRENTVACPYCERSIYPGCEYEEWEQVIGKHIGKGVTGFMDMEKTGESIVARVDEEE